VDKVKVGDKAITKYSMGDGSNKAGQMVTVVEVRYKSEGFSKKNYIVKYPDDNTGCWTRWELKKVWR
jgi:hypothetical protein